MQVRPMWTPGESLDRRAWLVGVGVAGLAGLLPAGCARRNAVAPPDDANLMRFPQKVALRAINDRAPCLETPWQYYRHDLTPNGAFYVRWHLETIPTSVDLRTWRLRVGGRVERPLELSMEDLRRMEAVSVVAVNQCSGNSRSFFSPRVPGGQWRNGAMGNARWTGVRLSELLKRAGLRAGAVQVSFGGLDEGPLPSVPDFVKTLDVDFRDFRLRGIPIRRFHTEIPGVTIDAGRAFFDEQIITRAAGEGMAQSPLECSCSKSSV